MTQFRFAHGSGTPWSTVVDRCLGQLTEAGPCPTGVGFLYVTENAADDLPETIQRLRLTTGVQDWVGSVGVGVCATGAEYFGQPAMATMIAEISDADFRVFAPLRRDLAAFRADNAAWHKAAESHFAIVHGDPRNSHLAALVGGLAAELDGYLVGGLSSARGATIQVANGVTEGGLSGVLFSENVTVATGLTQSCLPIGPRRTITHAKDNLLIELDGRPALAVFKDDIGELLARDLRRVEGYIFVALPIAGSDMGDYLVRNLMSIDATRQTLAINELVKEGSTIQFCRRDARAAEDDLVRMIAQVKRRANAPPKGAVYFSCIARGPNMFGGDSGELSLIERELGDVPLVGFFGFGEIAHDRLYGYTGVLTLFQ